MTKLSSVAIFGAVLPLILSLSATGDEPAKKSEPQEQAVEVVSVTIHPAKSPIPALKYRLLPTLLERTPGNAVPLYTKAFVLLGQESRRFFDEHKLGYDEVDKWLKTPLDQLPRDQVKKVLGIFWAAMRQVEQAVGRERCDWDSPLRQGRVFEILLPETQEIRNFGRLFALQSRLRVAEGKVPEAIAALRAGYGLARQNGEQPFLINGAVGAAIVRMMDEQLLALCQLPDAPNLYWSITALPSPMIDLERCAEGEYDGLYLQFPRLQELRQSHYTPDQWNLELHEAVLMWVAFQRSMEGKADPANKDPVAVMERLLAAAPTAKADLIVAGYPQKELDAMPPAQIVLLQILATYDEFRDDLFKWSHLPYWQAQPGMIAFDHDLQSGKHRELIPTASVLLPGFSKVIFVFARVERELAALRCIEALRLYAAGHDGKLPATLNDIREVPIPINPITGKPFAYRLDGETAVLDADGSPTRNNDRQYRVTVAK